MTRHDNNGCTVCGHVDVAVDEASLEGLLLRLGMVETLVPACAGRDGRGGAQ